MPSQPRSAPAAWKTTLRSEPKVARLLLRRLIGPLVLYDESTRPDFIKADAVVKPGLLDGLEEIQDRVASQAGAVLPVARRRQELAARGVQPADGASLHSREPEHVLDHGGPERSTMYPASTSPARTSSRSSSTGPTTSASCRPGTSRAATRCGPTSSRPGPMDRSSRQAAAWSSLGEATSKPSTP